MSDIIKKLEGELAESKNKFNAVPGQWALNEESALAMSKVNALVKKSKAASLYSRIPIKCRGEECKYRDACYIDKLDIDIEDIKNQVCPIETVEIINKFNDYIVEFEVDPDNQQQSTLVGLIKELVDCDIFIMRAEARIQAEGHFLEDRCVGVDSEGRAIMNREISKNFEFKNKIEERKSKILQLLNATPKDKAGSKLTVTMDPSTYATSLLRKAKNLGIDEVIDVDYNDSEE